MVPGCDNVLAVDTWERADEEKLAELVLYVAQRLLDDPAGGATKLNKVLFFAEFAHVRAHGAPITGVAYQRLPQGPAPRRLVPVRDRLVAGGDAEMRTTQYFGRTMHRLVPLRPADTGRFATSELQVIDQVIDALKGKNAGEVSERSHDEVGWQLARDGEDIPFAMAFVDNRDVVTNTSRGHAAALAARLGISH